MKTLLYLNPRNPCLLLHRTPVTSHWIQTQQTETSICLRGTGGWKGDELQSYPDHPDRFNGLNQVLCRMGVSVWYYWAVELSGWVESAVTYESSRKGQGDEWVFGWNDQSWRLFLFRSCSYFRHNNTQTELPLVARSRIVVYVEHRAGTPCRRVIVSEAVEGQSSDHMCTNVLFIWLCVCDLFQKHFCLHLLKSSYHPDSNE